MARTLHAQVDYFGRLAHGYSPSCVFAIEHCDVHDAEADQHDNGAEQRKIGSQTSRVPWRLCWSEQMWADYVASACPNEEDSSGHFALRVASRVLSGPAVDERRDSGVNADEVVSHEQSRPVTLVMVDHHQHDETGNRWEAQ